MNENDRIRILHILEAIQDIENFTKNISRDSFLENRLIRSAVARQFEIIGEASGSVSDELQAKYNSIPWRIIKNFRNILIHRYFGVDYNEVYTVIENELSDLREKFQSILNDSGEQDG